MTISTVSQVATTEKIVALTFDDGPHPVYTPKALEILGNYDAYATWFVLGSQVKNNPNLLKQVSTAGHEIGTHSFDHVYLTGLSKAQIVSQLGRTKELIISQTGQFWPYFRPTYGAYNSTVLAAAESLEYRYNVLWSVDPRDYSASTNQIINRVLSGVRPGSIVLLHEVTSSTTQALPTILRALRDRGYKSVTITELLKAQPVGPTQCRPLTVTTPYMRGDDVLAVQTRLAEKGFSPGPIDGIYGPQTSRAVQSFQQSASIPATGNVDRTTYMALGIKCPDIPTPSRCRTLEVQSPYLKGDDVLAVQTSLSSLGFNPGPVDGIFGPLTSAAVWSFQSSRGLPATGVVDAATYLQLGIKCP